MLAFLASMDETMEGGRLCIGCVQLAIKDRRQTIQTAPDIPKFHRRAQLLHFARTASSPCVQLFVARGTSRLYYAELLNGVTGSTAERRKNPLLRSAAALWLITSVLIAYSAIGLAVSFTGWCAQEQDRD